MSEEPNAYEMDASTGLQIRVLLVDDQALQGKLIGRMLEQDGDIDFRHCKDPGEALIHIQEFRPTVLLLDLVMPKISGLELLQQIRANRVFSMLPVIMLSGREEAQTKAEAFSHGANDYVVKLPEPVELLARIRYHSRSYIRRLQLDDAMAALEDSQRNLELSNRLIRKTFGKYFSDEVAQEVLQHQDGIQLGGEQRNVTIMMADLRGFSVVADVRPAAEVVDLINNFLGVMTKIILNYRGTIIEFIGDAILAIFGAPLEHEDDAGSAIACALEMQCAMETVNDLNRSMDLPELEMGIGLNTGDAAVGNFGSEQRIKYGVVGRHVNLTARIESYTVGRQVLVSTTTLEKAGPIVLEESRMEVKPKGLKEPIIIHEVTGIGGRYNIHLPELDPDPVLELRNPIPIKFSLVSGKDSGDLQHDGFITRTSQREVEIRTDQELEVHASIKLRIIGPPGRRIPGNAYAKIVSSTEERTLLHYTARTPEYDAFLKGILFWE